MVLPKLAPVVYKVVVPLLEKEKTDAYFVENPLTEDFKDQLKAIIILVMLRLKEKNFFLFVKCYKPTQNAKRPVPLHICSKIKTPITLIILAPKDSESWPNNNCQGSQKYAL